MKWIERVEKLKEALSSDNNYSNYRKLSMLPPCIPFIGVTLKDLVYTCEATSDETEIINMQKARMIFDIVHSLRLEDPAQVDYSHLQFDPEISQLLLEVRNNRTRIKQLSFIGGSSDPR